MLYTVGHNANFFTCTMVAPWPAALYRNVHVQICTLNLKRHGHDANQLVRTFVYIEPMHFANEICSQQSNIGIIMILAPI